MAGKLTPRGQARLAALDELLRPVQSVHGLVEHFAAARTGQPQQAQIIKRTFSRLKLRFTGAGFDSLAQLAASLELAAGRSMSQPTKAKILREGVASMKFQLELEHRAVLAEEKVAEKVAPKPDD
ncbi:MAG: hypothetical protein ACRELD_07610 [Longimicrobiales bacterium]